MDAGRSGSHTLPWETSMALINHRAREIHFKIVYVGPGLGGKTTNL